MKTGETVGANHAFIGQEQAFVKAQRARDGRGYSEDEVCDAGEPVGVHWPAAEVDGRDKKRLKTGQGLRNKEEALMGDMLCTITPAILYVWLWN
jgi:hypothetical protein